MRVWIAWILVDCEEQLWDGLIEASPIQMRGAYLKMRWAYAGARTKAQRDLEMLDRGVGLARPIPKHAADEPAASEIWVEHEGMVDQRYHRPHVFPEIGERDSGVCQGCRIVTGDFQSAPRKIGSFQTIGLLVFAVIVNKEPITAESCPGERGPVMRIAFDRSLDKTQRLRNLARGSMEYCIGAEIKS